MPFFFDLSSLIPTIERNPFEPVVFQDEVPAEPLESEEEIAAEPIVDTGLPIPSHYDFDMMRAMVQDPFHLFVYWHLKANPFERLHSIFPAEEIGNFHTVLKLIDETNNISVLFNAAFAREYWFEVFPDRTYRIELGVHSSRYGYIKQISSQSVQTPRGGPSDKIAEEEAYQISADDYLHVLRESHLVSERAYTIEELLPEGGGVPAGARNGIWESLPASFRRLMRAIADIQAGREYDRWWDRLNQVEMGLVVREFVSTINDMGQMSQSGRMGQMGNGELGYMLLLRYLPELLRRTLQDENNSEIHVDKPISLYLAERLGLAASEWNQAPSLERARRPGAPTDAAGGGQEKWLPSMTT